MEYVKKICPICGNEFVVLKKVEEKAIYCKLECLSASQGKIKREKTSSLVYL
ncbi:hypothetical protein [Methanosarcina sp.]|uniref:hypothetical protein n=1 Tax=Methanosarcina sp. TaxID=2213 RepID=UPI002ABB406D|nr:hypothetical protein [Methanosarcina sp.]MDY9926293.1 hypothetical protein [Methanosarcina sp.]